jgi:hypothetical protein
MCTCRRRSRACLGPGVVNRDDVGVFENEAPSLGKRTRGPAHPGGSPGRAGPVGGVALADITSATVRSLQKVVTPASGTGRGGNRKENKTNAADREITIHVLLQRAGRAGRAAL